MIPLYTILVVAVIFAQAFFMSSEMALTTLNRTKLKSLADGGDKRAIKLSKFLGREGFFLGTTLVGTNLGIVISSVLATRIFSEYYASDISSVLATVILVPVTLVFAEIVPKIIARQFSLNVALNIIGPLARFTTLFYPIIVSVNFIAKALVVPFVWTKPSFAANFTKSDLKKVLLFGHEIGEMEASEVDLIHKILDFGTKKVETIMVPLERISSIDADSATENLKRMVGLTGFSRLPVYKGNKTNIIGIINIYDVLFSKESDVRKMPLAGFVREPVHISRLDSLDIALSRLRSNKQPMGIVVDDNENVVGIVTIEDILEEIVGEIEDTGKGA